MRRTYIPENLDLVDFLRANTPSFKYHIDNFYYLVSLITEIPTYNKECINSAGFVSINATMLQKKVHDYKQYLNYLLGHGIFESDRRYIVSKKSIGYRFAEKYQTPVQCELISKYSLVRRRDKGRKPSAIKRRKRSYPALYKWFNTGLLKVDKPGAIGYAAQELASDRLNYASSAKALARFNTSVCSINDLFYGLGHFSVDKTSGRVHTSLTVLKTPLRNYVSYGDQPLVSIDICNSQPFLAAALLDCKFYNVSGEFLRQNEDFNGFLGKKPPLSLANVCNSSRYKHICEEVISYIMLVNSEVSLASKGFQRYIAEVENGTIYDLIQTEYYRQSGEIISRQEAKKACFKVMYTDNRFLGQEGAELKRFFKILFPEVYKVFSIIKRKDNALLPCLLQAIESHIILDHICARITAERPDVPLFTIHDSVVCPVGFEEYVAAVIREEMHILIGREPKLKFEYWNPEKCKQSAA